MIHFYTFSKREKILALIAGILLLALVVIGYMNTDKNTSAQANVLINNEILPARP